MSSTNKPSNKPCSACKFLRRKCTQQCIFAPYFPADKPQLFAYVHSIYGASNVGKILHELSASQRADCVKSLTYEAEARIRDPVYGCVGTVYELQQRMRQLNTELQSGKEALSTYGPQAMQHLQAIMADPNMAKAMMANSMGKVMPKQYGANNAGFPLYENTNIVAARHNQLVIQEAEQQELLVSQQLAAAQQQRELMIRSFEQQPQHQPLVAASHNQLVIQDTEQQELLEAQQLATAQLQRELMMRSYEQQQQEPLVAAPHFQSVIQDAEQQELLEAQQLAAAQQQRELMIRSFEQQQQQEFMRYGGFEQVGGGWLNQMGGGGGGPARLALGNFDNVSLYQIQRQQQGEQQHHHPDTDVHHSHPHSIEAQHHHDKQGLEDLLDGGGGLARLALGNFDNVSLDQIQQQQQEEQRQHHPQNHVPHSQHHRQQKQQLKQSLEDLLSDFDVGYNP